MNGSRIFLLSMKATFMSMATFSRKTTLSRIEQIFSNKFSPSMTQKMSILEN